MPINKAYVDGLVREVHDRIGRARASAADTVNEVWYLKQQINVLAAVQLRLISMLMEPNPFHEKEVQSCVESLVFVLRETEEKEVDWENIGKPEESGSEFDWGKLPAKQVNPPTESFLD